MQQEIRFATFNAFNLAPPGVKLYDNLAPLTEAEYEAKLDWTARQIDLLDADLIGFQEIFSQDVLRAALARSTRYRDALHIGVDQPARAERPVPNVALVSRLPLAAPAVIHTLFPAGVALPDGGADADHFARPAIHAQIAVAPGRIVDVIVVHLKSKRPDYRNGDSGDDPQLHALACLRSLIRRGTEAVALRVLLSGMAKQGGARPRVVMGDFNDVAEAVTTGIVLGAGAPLGARMFDAYALQRARAPGFSTLHDGHYSTIDHILVSEEFNAALPQAVGEVVDVAYLNDHLVRALPGASDHGQVIATVRLFEQTRAVIAAGR